MPSAEDKAASTDVFEALEQLLTSVKQLRRDAPGGCIWVEPSVWEGTGEQTVDSATGQGKEENQWFIENENRTAHQRAGRLSAFKCRERAEVEHEQRVLLSHFLLQARAEDIGTGLRPHAEDLENPVGV